MSNRKESLKRRKRLDQITRGQGLEFRYKMAGDKEIDTGRLSKYFWILIAVGCACVITAGVLLWIFFGSSGGETVVEEPQIPEDPVVEATMPPVTGGAVEVESEPDDWVMPTIATFFQGPKAWKKRVDWSGKWGNAVYDYRRFGGFGCGLCVMANFYSSYTPYQCSPIDMYQYAKQVSTYPGGCAIDWPQIKDTLESAGFTVDTNRKPRRYARFRNDIQNCLGAMVVISSAYDDSYWKETPGHYVTLLAYNEKYDTIFLGDSGDLSHNRAWVPLRTVYRAIKRSNPLHYLRILAYDEEKDQWKHKTISGRWIKPDYWEK